MSRIRSFLEDVAIYVGGTVIVLMMCVLYLICRLLGVRMDEDF